MRALNSSLSPAGVQGGGSLALRDRRVAAAISVVDAFVCARNAAPTEGGVSTAAHVCWSALSWLKSEVPSSWGCGDHVTSSGFGLLDVRPKTAALKFELGRQLAASKTLGNRGSPITQS